MIKLAIVVAALVLAPLAQAADLSTPYEFESDKHRMSFEYIIQSRVADNLKDPSSAVFSGTFENSKGSAYCGLVNSKNSFGAYTGNSRWVSTGTVTYLEGSSEFSAADFNYTYSIVCK